MKVNQPVTDREVNFREGQFIVSTTDLKGAITSVNRDFVEISGFSEQELLGRNHNIVRHPDMPPAAFADLWRTVKSGRPWTGLVKNRCKNGDFYWVKANVTPVRVGGSVTGYLSVRTAPARAEVAAADALYRRINAGQATLGPGFTGRLVARLGRVSIRWWAGCYLGVTMAMLAGFAWLGAQGLATGTLALALGAAALLLGGSGLLLGRHVTVPVATAITTLRQIAEGDYFHGSKRHGTTSSAGCCRTSSRPRYASAAMSTRCARRHAPPVGSSRRWITCPPTSWSRTRITTSST